MLLLSLKTLRDGQEINCNIGVKQDCPLSPTLFGIYIDKLEEFCSTQVQDAKQLIIY
jgi:hypothetical protein